MLILLKVFHEIQRDKLLSNSFLEASIPDSKIRQKSNWKRHSIPICLMNIDKKIPQQDTGKQNTTNL